MKASKGSKLDNEIRDLKERIRELERKIESQRLKLDIMAERQAKKLKTNPKKETLACG